MLKPLQWSEEAYMHLIERDTKLLSKMYPLINVENKYILFLKFELYWQYVYDNVEASFEIIRDDDILKLPDYKIVKPYPNKKYFVPVMVKGNKTADCIPMIFDTYEEINKIKQVLCRWKISWEKDGVNNFHCIQVLYNVNFTKDSEENMRIYSIHSREMDINYLRTPEAIKSIFKGSLKFDEYDKVFQVKNTSKGTPNAFESVYIKGFPDDEEDIPQDCLLTTFNNINIQEFINNPNLPFSIDSYCSAITLTPDIGSTIGG